MSNALQTFIRGQERRGKGFRRAGKEEALREGDSRLPKKCRQSVRPASAICEMHFRLMIAARTRRESHFARCTCWVATRSRDDKERASGSDCDNRNNFFCIPRPLVLRRARPLTPRALGQRHLPRYSPWSSSFIKFTLTHHLRARKVSALSLRNISHSGGTYFRFSVCRGWYFYEVLKKDIC